jgi:putative ABC transport system permease protein
VLRNYIKIAIRNLWRNKSITAIKLIGLIAGFTGVILIIAYVRFELSYDHYNKKASRIYRVDITDTTKDVTVAWVPIWTGRILKQEFPNVESSTSLAERTTSVEVGNRIFSVKMLQADSSFFNIFTIPLIKGNPKTALSSPYSVVISQKTVRRLFGNKNPMNRSIIISANKKHPFNVTGVMKAIPVNSQFHGDIILSTAQYKWAFAKPDWKGYTSRPRYILLKSGSNIQSLNARLPALYKKYHFPSAYKLSLMPLTRVHLHSHLPGDLEKNSDIKYIYIFSIIALLILGIACFNFINLTTASYMKRTKEVGIRKVLGADQWQLRMQFLSEGFILFTVAILMAFILAEEMIPWFSGQMNIPLNIHSVAKLKTITYVLILDVFITFLAGYYPSVFLSRLSPSTVLRGRKTSGRGHLGIRRSLVLLQFIISIGLVVGTLFIYSQMHYIHTKNLGFNKNNVLMFPRINYGSGYIPFKNKLMEYQGITDMSIASWDPTNDYGGGYTWSDKNDSTRIHNFHMIYADFNFLITMQIPLVSGRDFSEKYGTDNARVDSILQKANHTHSMKLLSERPMILNQSAVKDLELRHPVGKKLTYGALQGKVIGVVKNFNGLSLYKHVGPLAIYGHPATSSSGNWGQLFVRIKPANVKQTLAYIHKMWKNYFPGLVFRYSFLDQYISKQYNSAKRMSDLGFAFTILAFLISCLGLFGLVLFDTERRTKEIAIRKVFGASLSDILQLINKNFVLLVLIANIIAGPIAWFLVRKWLNNFAYRIDMTFTPFSIAIAVSLILTILTVSIQTLRTTRTNPAENLKDH